MLAERAKARTKKIVHRLNLSIVFSCSRYGVLPSLAIQFVDKARSVEFFDEACVHVILWVGVLRRRNPLREIRKNSFEPFESRIRFDLYEAPQQLVGIFQFLFIPDLHALSEGSF